METLTHCHRHRFPLPFSPCILHPPVPPSLDACIDWARGSSSTLISLEVWERRYEGTKRVTPTVPSGLTCEKKSLSIARKRSTLLYFATDVISSETDDYRDATLFSFHRGGYGPKWIDQVADRLASSPYFRLTLFTAGVLLFFKTLCSFLRSFFGSNVCWERRRLV